MGEFKKLLFIVNKYAGTGYQPQLEGRILDACEAHNIECTIEFTQGPGHATILARDHAGKFDGIIAVGGDGTVNETARGLVHSATPMGIIPKGSGNGFARHLGIHMDIRLALEDILTGTVCAVDTFTLNGRLSLNVSGLGFDGHIANLFGAGTKRGFWGYAKLIVREFFRYREITCEVVADARTFQTTGFMIALANSAQYGNNAWVAPRASVRDGLLHLVSVRRVSLLRGIPFAYRMFTRKLKDSSVYSDRSFARATLHCPAPVAYHVDGEPCGHAQDFDLVIQPASLPMIVPTATISRI